MASSLAVSKFLSKNYVEVWDHDPDTASAIVVTPDGGTTDKYIDMKGYGVFTVLVIQTVLSGTGVTKVEIVAADDTTGTNLTVIRDSGAITLNALAEWWAGECTAAEIKQLSEESGYNLRYVSVRTTQNGAGDESIVVFIASQPTFAYSDLTADGVHAI
jgi:hypothetical protein